MTIRKVTVEVFVDTQQSDEELGLGFERGVENALSHYPDGEVIYASVDTVVELTPEEITEHGFEEG